MTENRFEARHHRLRDHLDRHGASSEVHSVAMTGASGLVGEALGAFLASGGHRITKLVRREPASEREARWDPASGEIDASALEGLDGVIHLAGESVAGGRWTARRKEAIRSSRIDGTRLLCETLARLERKPRYLICANAIGYYGSRGDELVDETTAAGEGFLAEVCREWESATRRARDVGIRVVHLRIGIVVAENGGALAKMLTPFKLGAGGRVGSGQQWMSWIALDDLIGAIHHLMHAEHVAGAVNAVAPSPARNIDFVKTLGRVLRRPTIAPLPAFVVRLVFGEMGQALLLDGQRVQARRLLADGFRFLEPELEGALRSELGLPDGTPATGARTPDDGAVVKAAS